MQIWTTVTVTVLSALVYVATRFYASRTEFRKLQKADLVSEITLRSIIGVTRGYHMFKKLSTNGIDRQIISLCLTYTPSSVTYSF